METQSRDASPDVEKVQIELLRTLSIPRRLDRAFSLSSTAIFLSRRAIRRANPGLSDREADLAFVALHYGDDLEEKVRTYLEKRDAKP